MSVPRRGAGAVEEFDFVRFGGPTKTAEAYFNVLTVAQRILVNDPDRVCVIVQNNGPDVLYWSANANPTFPQVFQVANGQQLVLQIQDDGAMCSDQMWAVSAVAQSQVYIKTLVRNRGG